MVSRTVAQLSVTYNDDYGVNAGLKAAISKAGFSTS
jgi:hypothetical protein